MQLVEKHIIKKGKEGYKELERVTHLSKNLYNAGLYAVRQKYFNEDSYMNYNELDKLLNSTNNVDYRALPAKISQWVLKMVDQNFKSFFKLKKLQKSGQYAMPVNIPSYLPKGGNYLTTYTIQAISAPALAEGIIKLSGCNFTLKTNKKNIKQVRIVPGNDMMTVEIVYNVDDVKQLEPNGIVAGIDLGVSNLAVVTTNVSRSIIIPGGELKSINQYYNKVKAELVSDTVNRQLAYAEDKENARPRRISNRIRKLTNVRNNKVNDYLHKSSRVIVDYLTTNGVSVLVIGNNKGWKQTVNMSKQNNQNFCYIPHERFIRMVTYKCNLVGISVIVSDESHTSKCSFVDNEPVCHHESYVGKRVKRGLFVSSDERKWNADWNGSMNVIRKCIGDFAITKVAYQPPVRVDIRKRYCSVPVAV